MSLARRVLIVVGCLVAGWLCVALVGGFVPQLLGPVTQPVLALVLGGLIYRDIRRREARPADLPTR
jgi:uncharacterized membrane-anchored protein